MDLRAIAICPQVYFIPSSLVKMRALAFPLRLKENGLLEKQDRANSMLDLLQVMARTPSGSWAGNPSFGLRDLFEGEEGRADVARLALARINEAFRDLGLDDFIVTDVRREVSLQNGVDQYAITLQAGSDGVPLTTVI